MFREYIIYMIRDPRSNQKEQAEMKGSTESSTSQRTCLFHCYKTKVHDRPRTFNPRHNDYSTPPPPCPAPRRAPHNASRLVQAISAWLKKTRRAPSRHSGDARVYGHTTTAMHKLSTSTPPPPNSAPPFTTAPPLIPHEYRVWLMPITNIPSRYPCCPPRRPTVHHRLRRKAAAHACDRRSSKRKIPA